jgi:hypothetical protein
MLTRRVFVVVAVGAAAAVMAAPSAAWSEPWGSVDCHQLPSHPVCDIEAGAPPEAVGTDEHGEVVCRWDGEVVPCVDEWGWFGGDGCYYRRVDASAPSGAAVPGAAYVPRCLGDPAGSQRAAVWFEDGAVPGVSVLGELAVARLVLPQPPVQLSPPPAAQLVGLPVWLWVDAGWWVPRQAAVSAGGLTVTAVAWPVSVLWSPGDGARVDCGGPGVPFTPEAAGRAPACGHVYGRSSAGQPGGVFVLEATVMWEVVWSGGGVSGSAPGLVSTATVAVAVSEAQAVRVR